MILNKKRMRLIKQKSNSDCGICSMAMLTGIPHKKIIKLVGINWNDELGLGSVRESLLCIGFREKRTKLSSHSWSVEPLDFNVFYCNPMLSPSYFAKQLWGRRALVTVPSLNYKDGLHMVYWHYNKLYDPSRKKTYKDFKELKPTQFTVFMEK